MEYDSNWWSTRLRGNRLRREKYKEVSGLSKALINGIADFEIQAIPMEENQEVNALSKYALGALPLQEVHCIESSIHSIIEEKAMPTK